MRYAVFDLGSNSVKFLIAEKQGASFCVLKEQSRATRLAEDLIVTGNLKQEAIDRTLAALRELRARRDTSC